MKISNKQLTHVLDYATLDYNEDYFDLTFDNDFFSLEYRCYYDKNEEDVSLCCKGDDIDLTEIQKEMFKNFIDKTEVDVLVAIENKRIDDINIIKYAEVGF